MKRILASILAVVLLGTMAISGFAAETAEIVSGTAQDWTSENGSTVQITPDGHAIITVSEEDAATGTLETPVKFWEGSDLVVILPEGYDSINLVFPFTPATKALGWGIVGLYDDPDSEDPAKLENTFDAKDQIVLFNVPADTEVTLKNEAVKFDDVANDAWYAKYFDYASAHDYVVGNGDGTAAPDEVITDAALYAVLLRLAGVKEGTTGPNWEENVRAAAKEAQFAIDKTGELSRKDAMDIVSLFIGTDAVDAGIFIGDEFGNLDPNGAFIRAHLAVISMRLVEYLNGYTKTAE